MPPDSADPRRTRDRIAAGLRIAQEQDASQVGQELDAEHVLRQRAQQATAALHELENFLIPRFLTMMRSAGNPGMVGRAWPIAISYHQFSRGRMGEYVASLDPKGRIWRAGKAYAPDPPHADDLIYQLKREDIGRPTYLPMHGGLLNAGGIDSIDATSDLMYLDEAFARSIGWYVNKYKLTWPE